MRPRSLPAWLEVACVAYLFARLRTEPTWVVSPDLV